MHPVRLQPLCQSDRIIDDESHVMRRADRLKRFGKTGSLVLIDPLHTKLEGGDKPFARRQRAFEPQGKVAADVERRDEIKLGVGHGAPR
jgi:hypothetical protein